MRKLAVALSCALCALCMAFAVPDEALACRDYDGHHNSNVPPSCGSAYGASYSGGYSIHEVVSATWPASLAPLAETIAWREGGGIWNDGYCSFGIIESTQAAYGIDASSLDPYGCSEFAYQIYRDVGWGAWTTASW